MRIQPGDTVLVAYPSRCCDGMPTRKTFVVQTILLTEWRCMLCGGTSNGSCAVSSDKTTEGLSVGEPLYRLVKIAGEDVDVSEDSTIQEPAC